AILVELEQPLRRALIETRALRAKVERRIVVRVGRRSREERPEDLPVGDPQGAEDSRREWKRAAYLARQAGLLRRAPIRAQPTGPIARHDERVAARDQVRAVVGEVAVDPRQHAQREIV